MRVLVVEDHEELAATVAKGLRREGMAVDVALDGGAALARAAIYDYDVIVLDRDLPGVHGDDVCERLVEEGGRSRVLMLTASTGIEDRVAGLSLGADDYMPKPFAFAELVARIRALARRAQPARPPVMSSHDLRLDPAQRVAGSLRDTCERVLAAGEQQERLIEALLTLARSQRGLDSRVNLDLAAIAAELVRVVGCNGVDMQSELGQAFTIGDPALVERLVANLIDNALQYNEPDGWVRTWTGVRNGSPTVLVANTGPVIPADQTDALSEPFRRLNGGRTGHDPGLGLGLSIVSAIATAHDARFTATARPDGGLVAEVAFPPA